MSLAFPFSPADLSPTPEKRDRALGKKRSRAGRLHLVQRGFRLCRGDPRGGSVDKARRPHGGRRRRSVVLSSRRLSTEGYIFFLSDHRWSISGWEQRAVAAADLEYTVIFRPGEFRPSTNPSCWAQLDSATERLGSVGTGTECPCPIPSRGTIIAGPWVFFAADEGRGKHWRGAGHNNCTAPKTAHRQVSGAHRTGIDRAAALGRTVRLRGVTPARGPGRFTAGPNGWFLVLAEDADFPLWDSRTFRANPA